MAFLHGLTGENMMIPYLTPWDQVMIRLGCFFSFCAPGVLPAPPSLQSWKFSTLSAESTPPSCMADLFCSVLLLGLMPVLLLAEVPLHLPKSLWCGRLPSIAQSIVVPFTGHFPIAMRRISLYSQKNLATWLRLNLSVAVHLFHSANEPRPLHCFLLDGAQTGCMTCSAVHYRKTALKLLF